MSLPKRLYMVSEVQPDPPYAEWELLAACEPLCPHPFEWREFCLEKWGEEKPFFLPSADRVYRSRSAAQERSDLINYWGGGTIVVECTPEWEPVDIAVKRRKVDRLTARLEKASAKVAEIAAQIEAVAS